MLPQNQATESPTSHITGGNPICAQVRSRSVIKPYRCVRNIRRVMPFKLVASGAMDVTKTNRIVWPGDGHGTKPYEVMGLDQQQ